MVSFLYHMRCFDTGHASHIVNHLVHMCFIKIVNTQLKVVDMTLPREREDNVLCSVNIWPVILKIKAQNRGIKMVSACKIVKIKYCAPQI